MAKVDENKIDKYFFSEGFFNFKDKSHLAKETKIKVQTAIQGDKLRVSGKKRDDLQSVMSVLKELNLGIPLQYNNFRD